MLMAAVKVCENKMPPLAGNFALKMIFPLSVELLREMEESEDPRPFAVRVPLIRIEDWDHGMMDTRPSTSDIESEL